MTVLKLENAPELFGEKFLKNKDEIFFTNQMMLRRLTKLRTIGNVEHAELINMYGEEFQNFFVQIRDRECQ